MKKSLFVAALAILGAAAHASPFDCKPSTLVNGGDPVGVTFTRLTPVGAVAAWRCPNGNLNAAVVRWDWVTDKARAQWAAFAKDTSYARMDAMLLENKTGDWRTDPKLMEVWLPYKAQIEALKP